jgi:acyl-CoA thioesterase-1
MNLLILIVIILVAYVAYRLWQLNQEVRTYKYYWQQRAKRRESAELIYIALGDSSAQGVGASHPELGYVGLIADQLATSSGRQVHVINLSVSGARLRDVTQNQLPRLAKLPTGPGAFITLAVGANDMADFDEKQFTQEVSVLFAHLPSQTVVADVAYFGGGRKRKLEQHVLVANKIIKQAAAKHNLTMAPLHKVTKDNDSLLTMSVDLLHPSNRGYRNWYEAFRQAMGL